MTVLRYDLPASLVVFLVAVPLSLGVALASGAPLLAGLIAAVVGGIVVGLLGGSPLQVSGPAAGLTAVVADLVLRLGWEAMVVITVLAGLFQVVFGLVGAARLATAIPPAVVHGMLAGIGLTIAVSQLHVVLGGSPQAGVWENLGYLPARLAGMNTQAVLVGAVTIGLVLVWRLVPGRVPGPLVGVVAATGLALLWPGVPRVDLPGGLLDAVGLPLAPALGDERWTPIVVGALTVAAVASVESLLSAVAVDRMHDGPRTDPDRELVGQGAGNTVSGLLGGLPVTGVIVRSSANVRAGARTRAAAVLHGVWVAVFAVALVGVVELVPLSALAGLLVLVGVQLVRPADIRTAREHGELPVYLATAAGVLFSTLLAGVALGLAVAGLTVLLRAVRARIRVDEDAPDGAVHVVVSGALSFLAIPPLAGALARIPDGADVHVDLVVDYLDHAAFDHLDAWTRTHRLTGGDVTVNEPGRPAATVRPRTRFATWSEWQSAPRPSAALLAGLEAYHSETVPDVRPVMRELAVGQRPSGMLLTCADSRVVPNMITHSGPGDLFTVQNVGNLVGDTGTHAAVQYANDVLRVPLIAVCGHAGCGAMHALLERTRPTGPLHDWLDTATPSLHALQASHPVAAAALAAGRSAADALAMVNVAVQLGTLRRHGVTAELVGLFYDIPTAQVLVLDPAGQRFGPLREVYAGAASGSTC